jgi:hypothetical protein
VEGLTSSLFADALNVKDQCTGSDPASLTSLRFKKEDAVLGAEVFIKSSNA